MFEPRFNFIWFKIYAEMSRCHLILENFFCMLWLMRAPQRAGFIFKRKKSWTAFLPPVCVCLAAWESPDDRSQLSLPLHCCHHPIRPQPQSVLQLATRIPHPDQTQRCTEQDWESVQRQRCGKCPNWYLSLIPTKGWTGIHCSTNTRQMLRELLNMSNLQLWQSVLNDQFERCSLCCRHCTEGTSTKRKVSIFWTCLTFQLVH